MFRVTRLDKRFVADCKKLKKIVVTAKNIKKVHKNAFSGMNKKCIVTVPRSKYKKYKKMFRL